MSKSARKLWADHLAGKGKAANTPDPAILLKKRPYEGRILGIDPSLREPGWPCWSVGPSKTIVSLPPKP